MLFQVILPALLAATVALASPINKRAWPAGDVTCGSNVYSLDEIKAATAAGYDQVDDPIGDNSYPHTFNNYEGLNMWCSSETEYEEWPILKSGIYDGGDPVTDRIVFSVNGLYCATVTHTGASGNNFVQCKND